MKKEKTTAFTLLSEELDSQTLMNLFGGANAHPIPTFPHDLITPSRSSEPYDLDEPEES
ncbi:hypothetical protein [uncultured Kordia sp.]|uniref:hypothetical protein n=1 Tax=uncultured Kordia sp. TaxID=507699 RepID=UPI00260B219A|nr:hypothetical protein [uncultured Kordia sp.]